jgi:limonene-1,2-epoxide hydrolase
LSAVADERAAREAVERYFRCINTDDYERLGEVFHEDAEFRAVGARPRNGLAEIAEYFPKIFGLWKEHRDEPTRIVVAGDVVTAEVVFTGTTHDGRKVEFDAVDVIDVMNGRIKRLTDWYDIAWVRKQLEQK